MAKRIISTEPANTRFIVEGDDNLAVQTLTLKSSGEWDGKRLFLKQNLWGKAVSEDKSRGLDGVVAIVYIGTGYECELKTEGYN